MLDTKLKDDIIYNIMSGKIEKLRRELNAFRARKRSLRAAELISFAERIGRKRVKRGKEPTYERQGWFPLTIPNHPGNLAIGTASSILDQLEEDIERLASQINKREDHNEKEG